MDGFVWRLYILFDSFYIQYHVLLEKCFQAHGLLDNNNSHPKATPHSNKNIFESVTNKGGLEAEEENEIHHIASYNRSQAWQ